jgi:hypothetical protein
MTAKELIEKLQQFDPNTECMQYHWDWMEEGLDIGSVETVEKYDEFILIH